MLTTTAVARRRLRPAATLMVAAATLLTGCGTQTASDPAAAEPVTYTQWEPASTGDIVNRVPYDGLLTPTGTATVTSPASGTITRPPATGAVVIPGGPLAHVDELPVTVLPGAIPVYRDLLAPAAGELKGEDVAQLQRFLTATGFFSGTVNGRFSAQLGNAARQWRLRHDLTDARGFTKSQIVFVPGEGPWTVTKTIVAAGQAFSGGPLAELSQGGLGVAVSLDEPPPAGATYQLVPTGGADGGQAQPMTALGEAGRAEDGRYELTLSAPPGTTVDAPLGSAVVIEQALALASGVITIPVAAVRLNGAGQTVAQCRDSSQSAARECPIELGASNGISVEVRGGLEDGTEVAVAP
jgi:hypothetical protein